MDSNKLEKIATELHKMNLNLEKLIEQLSNASKKISSESKGICQIIGEQVLGCLPEIGSTGDKTCGCGENCGCIKHSNK